MREIPTVDEGLGVEIVNKSFLFVFSSILDGDLQLQLQLQTSHGLGWMEAHSGRPCCILNYFISTFLEFTSSRCTVMQDEIQTLLVCYEVEI